MSESSLDARLLGLEPGGGEGELRFVLRPHLCRPDGALYGGTALAATLAAMELVTGRPALWATTQLVSTAQLDDVIHCVVEPLARGKYIDQVRVTATVADRVLFAAVGSTATHRDNGLRGTGASMPRVTPPEEAADRGSSRMPAWGDGAVGQHRVIQFKDAAFLDGDHGPGRVAMWARLVDEPTTTAAKLGFIADMVPIAVAHAAGVRGAGTSLDNSLRVGELVDCDWMLLDIHGHIAFDGYGYGEAHCWSPDGVLLGTASQTAKVFTFEGRFGPDGPVPS